MCAQQCALNALAAVKAEVGDLAAVRRVVKVVGVRGQRARTSPASRRWPTVPASCSARCSATPVGTRAARSGWRCCRWTPRSRSSWSSRSADAVRRSGRGAPPPGAGASHSAEVPRCAGQRAAGRPPRDAATVVLLRDPGRGAARRPRGLPAAPARPDGVRRRAGGLPRRRGRRARPTTPTSGWAGPDAGAVGRAASLRRGRPRAGWSARRSGRRSRSPGCCWPGRTRRHGRRGHDRRRLGGRPGRAGGAGGLAGRRAAPARAGAPHRPARRLGALDHPGLRAAPLRHPVLRRGAAAGPADPRRVRRVRRGRAGCARPTRSPRYATGAGHDAADGAHLRRGGGVRARRPTRCPRRRAAGSSTGASRGWCSTGTSCGSRPDAR